MLIDDFIKLSGIKQCDKRRTLQIIHKVDGSANYTVLNQCIIDDMILVITDLKTYQTIKPSATRQKLGTFFISKLLKIKKAGTQYIEFLSDDTESFINGYLLFKGNNEFFLISSK